MVAYVPPSVSTHQAAQEYYQKKALALCGLLEDLRASLGQCRAGIDHKPLWPISHQGPHVLRWAAAIHKHQRNYSEKAPGQEGPSSGD